MKKRTFLLFPTVIFISNFCQHRRKNLWEFVNVSESFLQVL